MHSRIDEPLRNYYNRPKIVFKEDPGLPLDAVTKVAFNTLLTDSSDEDLTILVKWAQLNWETMASPNVANPANKST